MAKLKTETDTRAMGLRVLRMARAVLQRRGLTVHFEHGQWWVTAATGAQWSVVDAEGGPAVDGFWLEQVSQGDEP